MGMKPGTLVLYRRRLAWVIEEELLHESRPALHLQYAEVPGTVLAAPKHVTEAPVEHLSYQDFLRYAKHAESFSALCALSCNPLCIEAVSMRESLQRPEVPTWPVGWLEEAYDMGKGWEVLSWHREAKERLVVDYKHGLSRVECRPRGEKRWV